MSHTAETRAREYGKMLSRRAQWLLENGPCKRCGSNERLEVDHIDPSLKVHHKVWTWAPERRKVELDKCQPLCHDCHAAKTTAENRARNLGVPKPELRKLTPDVCAQIDNLKIATVSVRRVAEIIGLHHTTVSRYLRGVALVGQPGCAEYAAHELSMRERRRFPAPQPAAPEVPAC